MALYALPVNVSETFINISEEYTIAIIRVENCVWKGNNVVQA
jgi:hypothetical protein